MMYKTIDTARELRKEFIDYNRDYYSYEGYEAMLRYFDEVYPEGFELDIIAICCDFTEATEQQIRDNYNLNEEENVEDFLGDNTWYQETIEGSYIYISF